MTVVAPIAASSSMAMAVDGEPMPVEQTETARPSSSPVYVTYSRFRAIKRGLSSSRAIGSTRPGSPGRSTTSPTSPGLQRIWYCKSPIADVSLARHPNQGDLCLLAPGVGRGDVGLAQQDPEQRRADRLAVRDRHVDGGMAATLHQTRRRDRDGHEVGIDVAEVLQHGRADGGIGVLLRLRQATSHRPAGRLVTGGFQAARPDVRGFLGGVADF